MTGKDKRTESKQRTELRVYRSPKLREFGPVSALTQGGSGPVAEQGGMGMMGPMMQIMA